MSSKSVHESSLRIRSSLSLPAETLAHLEAVSSHLGISKSSLMVCLLRPTLRDLDSMLRSNTCEIDDPVCRHRLRLRGDSGLSVQSSVDALIELLELHKRGQY